MTAPDRETLTRHLADAEYPCGREELLRRAAAAGGGDAVLGPLGNLPADASYRSFDDVCAAVDAGRQAG
jgi:hypothetical protein